MKPKNGNGYQYTNYHGLQIFACKSSIIHHSIIKELNKRIAKLNLELMPPPIELADKHYERFGDGETMTHPIKSVRGADVFIISQPRQGRMLETDIREIHMMIHALGYIGKAWRINLVIPYFPYQKQDRVSKPRQPVSAKMLIREFERAGVETIITLQLHNPYTRYYGENKVEDIGSTDTLLTYLKEERGLDLAQYRFAAADIGATKYVSNAAKQVGAQYVIVDKRRPEGKPQEPEVMFVIGEEKLPGYKVILIDDQIATAGTAEAAGKRLLEKGADSVIFASTHPLILGDAPERLYGPIFDEVIVMDTCRISSRKKNSKLRVVSSAPLFAEAIDNVHNLGSMTIMNDKNFF